MHIIYKKGRPDRYSIGAYTSIVSRNTRVYCRLATFKPAYYLLTRYRPYDRRADYLIKKR